MLETRSQNTFHASEYAKTESCNHLSKQCQRPTLHSTPAMRIYHVRILVWVKIKSHWDWSQASLLQQRRHDLFVVRPIQNTSLSTNLRVLCNLPTSIISLSVVSSHQAISILQSSTVGIETYAGGCIMASESLVILHFPWRSRSRVVH